MPNQLEQAADFRERVLRGELEAADEIVRSYGQAWTHVRALVDGLTAEVEAERKAGRTVDVGWLHQRGRLKGVLREAGKRLQEAGRTAAARVTREQSAAVATGEEAARSLLTAGAGAGSKSRSKSTSSRSSSTPSTRREELVGYASDGTPLRAVFAKLGDATRTELRKVLVTGVAAGQDPGQIAARAREALGGGLTRALTTSRTEVFQSYRESSRRTYAATGESAPEWVWVAELSTRTCAACIAMHGTVHPITEPLGSHPNCRCTAVPWVKGGPGAEPPPLPETGVEWFARQSAADQEAILGPAKFAAWREGKFALPEVVGFRADPKWGPTRWELPLRGIEAGLGEETKAEGSGPGDGAARNEEVDDEEAAAQRILRLAPELRALAPEHRDIWAHPEVRRQALQKIRDAYVAKDEASLAEAVKRVDDAITAGMAALGYPRGEVKGVGIEALQQNILGVKRASCQMRIGEELLLESLNPTAGRPARYAYSGRPDTPIRTWVHESLHGRKEFDRHFDREYRKYNGYEEGMVEGLARIITKNKAGMDPATPSYNFYAHAYAALAAELGVSHEELLKELWRYRPGLIRETFVGEIGILYERKRLEPLTDAQRSQLQTAADRLFRKQNVMRELDDRARAEIAATWKKALK